MQGITVKELHKFCEEVINLGLEDRVVLVPGDEEGNWYNTLDFGFEWDPRVIERVFNNSETPSKLSAQDVVLLG